MADATPAHTEPPARSEGGGGFRLGRVFGVEVRVDLSLFLVALLVALSLAMQLGAEQPGRPSWEYWLGAAVGSVLFFASLLLHELSHSLVARAHGATVIGITLFVFGGVSRLEGEPKRPRDELLIAAVGPLTSALLGLLFLGLAQLLAGTGVTQQIAAWLGSANLILAVFNLLPGFPLDGGRIFRAIAWHLTKSFRRATRLATSAGIGIGMLIMAFGGLLAIVYGQLGSGLWLALIGWFLMNAARGSRTQLEVSERLGRYRVRQVMREQVAVVSPAESVEGLVADRIVGSGQRSFFVTDGDALLGLVTLQEVKGVPKDAWAVTPVRAIMVPVAALRRTTPDETLLAAFERMSRAGVNQLPVIEGDVLRGMLTREDVLRVLATDLELDLGDEQR